MAIRVDDRNQAATNASEAEGTSSLAEVEVAEHVGAKHEVRRDPVASGPMPRRMRSIDAHGQASPLTAGLRSPPSPSPASTSPTATTTTNSTTSSVATTPRPHVATDTDTSPTTTPGGATGTSPGKVVRMSRWRLAELRKLYGGSPLAGHAAAPNGAVNASTPHATDASSTVRAGSVRTLTSVGSSAAASDVSPARPPVPGDDIASTSHEASKSTWDKIWEVIGKIFTVPGQVLAKGVSFVVKGVAKAVNALAWLVASPALLFGVKPDKLWNSISKVVEPAFGAVSGLVEGAVMAPWQLAGVATTFCKSFFSFKWATSGSKAIEMLTQPIIGGAMAAVAPLFFGFKGLSDALAPPEPLNAKEREQLGRYYSDDVLDRLRIVRKPSLIQKVFLPEWACAFTIGDAIYLNPDEAGWLDEESLVHETMHTLQYRDSPGNVVGFLSTYYARFFGNFCTNGFDYMKAYEDIPSEQEAYGTAGMVRAT